MTDVDETADHEHWWVPVERAGDDTGTSLRFCTRSAEIDLGDGLYMHEETQVVTRESTWDIDIDVGLEDGRLVADSIKVTRNSFSDGPVTSAVLREIPVGLLMNYAASGVFRRDTKGPNGERWGWAAWPTKAEAEYVEKHGLDDETLRIVARIYRVAYLIGDTPTKRVETVLKQPRSTAGRWVAAARKAGYLSDARGPGRAGA